VGSCEISERKFTSTVFPHSTNSFLGNVGTGIVLDDQGGLSGLLVLPSGNPSEVHFSDCRG